MSFIDIIQDNHAAISEVAREVGIDFDAISNLQLDGSKQDRLPVIDKKHKNKVAMWTDTGLTKAGKPFVRMTFRTFSHGGQTTTWSSFESRKQSSPPPKRNLKLVEKKAQQDNEANFRKENFLRYRSAYENAPRAAFSPYLERKELSHILDLPEFEDIKRLRDKGGDFIGIPLRNESGTFVGMERLYDNGKKRTAKGLRDGIYKRSFYSMGSLEEGGTIYVAEGFATAATAYLLQETGSMSVFTRSASNLLDVVKLMRAKHPGNKVVILADNDDAQDPSKGNTGMFQAISIANDLDRVSICFPPSRGEKTDWNDILVDFGPELTKLLMDSNTVKPLDKRLEQNLLLLKYAYKDQLKNLIRQIGFMTNIPFQIETGLLADIILEAVKGRYSRSEILKQLMGVVNVRLWKAREIADIRPSSVDSMTSLKTTRNERGHYDVPKETLPLVEGRMAEGDIVILKAPMGTGKTEIVIKDLMTRDIFRTAYLPPRRSLINDALSRFNRDVEESGKKPVSHYSHVCDTEIHFTEHLACCLQSIGAKRFRVTDDHKSWFDFLDIMCLDEAGQALPQLLQLGRNNEKKENFNCLTSALNSRSTVLVSDADANEYLVSQLRLIAPERKIHLVDVSHPESAQKSWNVSIAEEVNTGREAMLKAIKNGETVLIATDKKKEALRLEKLIEAHYPGTSVLNIHSEPSAEMVPAINDFYDNPNEACKNFQVLIYSPAITSGVSLSSPHFQRHIGIFFGVVKATEVLQMMGRDRTAKEWLICLGGRSVSVPNTLEQEEALGELGQEITTLAKFKFANDAFEAASRRDFVNLVTNILALKGHRVFPAVEVSATKSKRIKEQVDVISERLKDERDELIISLSQEIVTEETYRDLKIKWLATNEDAAKVIGYQITHYLCSEVNKENIDFLDNGGLSKIRLAEVVTGKESAVRALDKLQEEHDIDPALKFYAEEKRGIFNEVLSILGIGDEGWLGEFTKKECGEILELLMNRHKVINTLFKLNLDPKNPPKCATTVVKRLFALMGLKIGKRKSHGRMKRFVDRKSAERLLGYIERRSNHNASFVEQEFTALPAA